MTYATNLVSDVSITRAGLRFQYRFAPKGLPRLVVMMPAVAHRGSREPAADYVHRVKWAPEIRGDVLYVAEPTLQLSGDLSGGWFICHGAPHALPAIAADIAWHMCQGNYDELVIYGSIMGGFGALALGRWLPEARIVAECPQIDLSKYYPKFLRRLQAVCRCAEPRHYDVSEMWKVARPEDATLIVRQSDTHHRKEHAPLLKGLVRTIVHDDREDASKGHSPLAKGIVLPMINTPPRPDTTPAPHGDTLRTI